MRRFEYYPILKEKYPDIEAFSEIERTCRKIEEHIGSHEHICISVSGGSDSDCIVHLVYTYFPEYLDKCHFVFVNTGLEYAATKRHLCDLEKRYGITIDRIRGQSVVTVVKKYGIPILSKYKSEMIRKHINGNQYAWGYIFGDKVKTNHSMMFTDAQKTLVQYLVDNQIKISALCCTYSKNAS
jgi:3'-phosphoadenosine 5'-phosphosulfate sulfotransferase (PAPS reductase)/FAD synthetase